MSNTVAVVDGHYDIRDAIRILIETNGWDAHVYESGEAFLAELDMVNPHCAIMDLVLPGMSGFEVVRILGSRDPSIHVIILTTLTSDTLAESALAAGATAVLGKPVQAAQLVAEVRALLPT